MELDLRLQRALDGVELVSGTIGNPSDGRMCLMSLVAFLAGEDHTDSPHCASPLIQAFAIRINDNMPYKARQGDVPADVEEGEAALPALSR
jgi:hypothetical protein